MINFQSILQKRGLEECLLPLWKLKITDDEFKELRDLLEKRTHIINTENPFKTLCRECTLFFAEYWRRLYDGRPHAKQMVYDALESTRKSVSLCDEFYDAACSGARLLKIERYDGGRVDPLNDMLYQGGLPMKLVTANITNSVWDRFTRGLVNRKINFEELNLGLVASQSQSMKDYCEQLIHGIEADSHLLMPFYCDNEIDAWYLYLKELAKQEKTRRSNLRPFSLVWEFRIDTVEKKIYTQYIVKGHQRLPQLFLEAQGLDNTDFFSVQVKKNGQAVDTFDYANNFCRYAVESKHSFSEGDYISLYLHNQEDAHISDELDMSVPHILFKNQDCKYELSNGNQMGRQESIILIPEGWYVKTGNELNQHEYTWGDTKLQGLHVPIDYTNNIDIASEDGCITFGMNAPLYWTETQSHPLYVPNVIESLYDASKCIFILCCDTEDGTESKRRNVQYRNKRQNEWTDTPSYGEIFARAIDVNGNYVTPMKFINIGDGLVISLQKADRNTCQIKVAWPHGHVSTVEGEKKVGDVWEIKKKNCHDPRKIRFTLTPNDNSRNQFDISIKAPFKDFSIKNINDEDIENDCWIPYSDIDKYQYHLVGQDVREYTYGNIRRALQWKEEKLFIIENGRSLKTIPYEGSILTLFDSREMLRSLLEQTSQNMLNAEIKVQFTLIDGSRISFAIKDFPFRIKQLPTPDHVIITGNNKMPIKFNDDLQLIKLDDPNLDSEPMEFNEELGVYILPESIHPWGNTIVKGRTKGRVSPGLVNRSIFMDDEFREKLRERSITTIKENLQKSILGDDTWQRIIGWFNRAQKEDIPASSILDLSITAQDYKALLCLAFQLYVKCAKDERDILKEQLKTFSKDLAFQWYWLQPHLSGLFALIYGFMPNENPLCNAMYEIYIMWATDHDGKDVVKYLSALKDVNEYTNNLGQCLQDVLTSFIEWINDLCVDSMTEAYGYMSQGVVKDIAEIIIKNPNEICKIETNIEEYIESNQDNLGEKAVTFFNDYAEDGTYGNEIWLFKRVNAVAAHIQRKIDLFSMEDEIRRSIIFCCKSCNQHFVVSLNNKLSN